MTKTRKPLKSSKPEILRCAVVLAREKGLEGFSRIEVATAAKVGESTVSYHFGEMPELRKAVAVFAVNNEMVTLLADTAAIARVGVPLTLGMREKIAAYIAR